MRREVKFGLVGLFNTVLTYLIYSLLILGGTKYQAALIIEYVTGITIGYFLQRFWTFKSRKSFHTTFIKYLLLYLAIFAGNMFLLKLIINSTQFNEIVSQGFCLIILSIISFFIQKKKIF
ncbi:MAG: GtrA family protein [Candidatus Cloacimonetes bacterium]|nr:GtrA family protein [Candidatus Cloacimonadota bacterium]